MFEVSVSAAFEAAHYIDAKGGPDAYRTIHGHSFLVTATAAAEKPDPNGWVIDLGVFEQALKDVVGELDHAMLNDVPGLEQPTFENLLVWIDGKLQAKGVSASCLEIERPILRQRAVYRPAR
ncbi:MAG: 6-carboxytetrahydropterin synthase [Hyphomonadaceae bacterium]